MKKELEIRKNVEEIKKNLLDNGIHLSDEEVQAISNNLNKKISINELIETLAR